MLDLDLAGDPLAALQAGGRRVTGATCVAVIRSASWQFPDPVQPGPADGPGRLDWMEGPLPVTVAVVHGPCHGLGLEIALASMIILAADDASFALTAASAGTVPALGGAARLAQTLGPARAARLALTAAPFSARQAEQWGVVSAVAPATQLSAAAADLVTRLLVIPRAGLAATARQLRGGRPGELVAQAHADLAVLAGEE